MWQERIISFLGGFLFNQSYIYQLLGPLMIIGMKQIEGFGGENHTTHTSDVLYVTCDEGTQADTEQLVCVGVNYNQSSYSLHLCLSRHIYIIYVVTARRLGHMTQWHNLKLSISKTNEPVVDYTANIHVHLQPGSTEDRCNQYSFKVGTQDQCHQFSI